MAIKANTGQGGKTLNDRKLAGDVRTLAMREMYRVLKGTDEEYKKELILKLATTVLPRINEISGPDGGAVQIAGVEVNVRKNNS